MFVSVFDHHDSSVDHRADGDGNAAQAHDVRTQSKQVHAKIGNQHPEWQRDDRDQCAADMQQKNHTDQCNYEAFFCERALESVDGPVDQIGAVIDRIYGHSLRQTGRYLRKPILDISDHSERVLPKPLQSDAGDNLTLTVHLGNAAPLIRTEFDAGHILEQHRYATIISDHDLLKVRQAFDVTSPPHCELGFRKLDRAPAHIRVAGAQYFADFCNGNAKCLQAARINHNAVLLDEAANARDFRNALRLRNAVPDVPILDGAQFGQASLRTANHVLVHPPDTRCVRAKAWHDPDRQPAGGRTEVFEHTRARPIKIGAVLENHSIEVVNGYVI